MQSVMDDLNRALDDLTEVVKEVEITFNVLRVDDSKVRQATDRIDALSARLQLALNPSALNPSAD